MIASTHHPFYYRASTSTGADRPPFADEWVEKIVRFRETLTRARPDVLVMVGSDHFHQFWLDNMPQFLVGKAPFFDGNFYNEEREFGLPRMTLPGQEDLATHILRDGTRQELRPGVQQRTADRPQHHLPDHHPAAAGRPADRADLHQHLRPADAPAATVRRARPGHPGDGRELAVGPAGGDHRHRPPVARARRPRQFGPHGPDPDFDRKAVEWIATGDLNGCLAEVTLDSLHAPGNATHGFMDFMLMMGVAGEESPPTMSTASTSSTPWRPISRGTRSRKGRVMSKYLLNKFLYTVDRDPVLIERYREDPSAPLPGGNRRWRTRS